MTGTRTSPLSVLRFLAVASVVVYHAYRFTPGATVVAPPPAGSVSDFVRGCVSLALMSWALPFLGLVSGYLFFRRLTPSLAGFLVKLRTRARTVLVPFLIWSGLGVLFAVAITNSAYADVSDYWTMRSLGEALERWLLYPVTYPLRFLQALMACMLVIAVLWWTLGWRARGSCLWSSWAPDRLAGVRRAEGPSPAACVARRGRTVRRSAVVLRVRDPGTDPVRTRGVHQDASPDVRPTVRRRIAGACHRAVPACPHDRDRWVDRRGAPAQAARAARLRADDRRPWARAARGRVAVRRR